MSDLAIPSLSPAFSGAPPGPKAYGQETSPKEASPSSFCEQLAGMVDIADDNIDDAPAHETVIKNDEKQEENGVIITVFYLPHVANDRSFGFDVAGGAQPYKTSAAVGTAISLGADGMSAESSRGACSPEVSSRDQAGFELAGFEPAAGDATPAHRQLSFMTKLAVARSVTGTPAVAAEPEMPSQNGSGTMSHFGNGSSDRHTSCHVHPSAERLRESEGDRPFAHMAADTAMPPNGALDAAPPVSIGTVEAQTQHPAAVDAGPNEVPAPEAVSKVAEAPVVPKPPTAATEVTLRIGETPADAVEINVRERGGEVHVAVRTREPEVAAALRADLPELAGNLARHGFDADVWTPADRMGLETPAEMNSHLNDAQHDERGSAWDEQSPGNRHSARDQRGRRGHSRKDSKEWTIQSALISE